MAHDHLGDLVARDSGSYPPFPNPTFAPANYAFSYTNSPGLLTVAVRDAQAGLASAPLSMSGGTGSYGFAPTGVSMAFTNGFVDNRHRPIAEETFRDALTTTSLADTSEAPGPLTPNESSISLQLPLDSTFAVRLHGPDGLVRDTATFRFFGTLNATGVVPEPSTWALASTALAGLVAAGMRRRR